MEQDTLTRVMWAASWLILVAALALTAFAFMGPLEGPSAMPMPPSATNYSTN